MAYDEDLAARIRDAFPPALEPRAQKMMGGLVFMVDGHMCCGLSKDGMMVRVGKDGMADATAQPGAAPMTMGASGRRLSGFVQIDPAAIEDDGDLRDWVARGLQFVATLPPK